MWANARTAVWWCFDIQAKGQSCVSPEQSICDSGNGYNFGDESASRCYAECVGMETALRQSRVLILVSTMPIVKAVSRFAVVTTGGCSRRKPKRWPTRLKMYC